MREFKSFYKTVEGNEMGIVLENVKPEEICNMMCGEPQEDEEKQEENERKKEIYDGSA